MPDVDVLILGAGPGGYMAALRAATLGARVALVEKEHLGGVCMNWGCIPTKALYRATRLYQEMGRAAEHGIEVTGLKVNLAAMIARKNRVVNQLRSTLGQLLQKRKVTVLKGFGYLLDARRVRVVGPGLRETLEPRFIILATGTECAPHPLLRVDHATVHDVRSILGLTQAPRHLFVVGGGVSGCEFAQVFSALGSQITMTKRSASPIKGLDEEIEKTFVRTLKKRKYNLFFGDALTAAEVGPGRVRATLASGQTVEADLALVDRKSVV
jgi:dihydrolipoamide dehydrogenase